MTYSTANQPRMIGGSLNASPRLWLYSSTDAAATVDGAGYFTDGYTLGMRLGDQVIVVNTTSKITTWHYVAAASATSVDLGDGTTIGSSTNSD